MRNPLWVGTAVIPKFPWPRCEIEIPFESRKIVLRPGTTHSESPDKSPFGMACTASVYDPEGIDFEEGIPLISKFLSRLAWSMDGGVIEIFSSGGFNPKFPPLMGQGPTGNGYFQLSEPPFILYLPIPPNEKAERALAIFREAMSVNLKHYAFVGFSKILNIIFPRSDGQIKWINSNLGSILMQPELGILHELQKKHSNIGSYLYKIRCAVAHAFNDVVNPDDDKDKRRVEQALPLMKELARMFIDKELGVKTEYNFVQNMNKNLNAPREGYLKKINRDGRIIYENVPQYDIS